MASSSRLFFAALALMAQSGAFTPAAKAGAANRVRSPPRDPAAPKPRALLKTGTAQNGADVYMGYYWNTNKRFQDPNNGMKFIAKDAVHNSPTARFVFDDNTKVYRHLEATLESSPVINRSLEIPQSEGFVNNLCVIGTGKTWNWVQRPGYAQPRDLLWNGSRYIGFWWNTNKRFQDPNNGMKFISQENVLKSHTPFVFDANEGVYMNVLTEEMVSLADGFSNGVTSIGEGATADWVRTARPAWHVLVGLESPRDLLWNGWRYIGFYLDENHRYQNPRKVLSNGAMEFVSAKMVSDSGTPFVFDATTGMYKNVLTNLEISLEEAFENGVCAIGSARGGMTGRDKGWVEASPKDFLRTGEHSYIGYYFNTNKRYQDPAANMRMVSAETVKNSLTPFVFDANSKTYRNILSGAELPFADGFDAAKRVCVIGDSKASRQTKDWIIRPKELLWDGSRYIGYYLNKANQYQDPRTLRYVRDADVWASDTPFVFDANMGMYRNLATGHHVSFQDGFSVAARVCVIGAAGSLTAGWIVSNQVRPEVFPSAPSFVDLSSGPSMVAPRVDQALLQQPVAQPVVQASVQPVVLPVVEQPVTGLRRFVPSFLRCGSRSPSREGARGASPWCINVEDEPEPEYQPPAPEHVVVVMDGNNMTNGGWTWQLNPAIGSRDFVPLIHRITSLTTIAKNSDINELTFLAFNTAKFRDNAEKSLGTQIRLMQALLSQFDTAKKFFIDNGVYLTIGSDVTKKIENRYHRVGGMIEKRYLQYMDASELWRLQKGIEKLEEAVNYEPATWFKSKKLRESKLNLNLLFPISGAEELGFWANRAPVCLGGSNGCFPELPMTDVGKIVKEWAGDVTPDVSLLISTSASAGTFQSTTGKIVWTAKDFPNYSDDDFNSAVVEYMNHLREAEEMRVRRKAEKAMAAKALLNAKKKYAEYEASEVSTKSGGSREWDRESSDGEWAP